MVNEICVHLLVDSARDKKLEFDATDSQYWATIHPANAFV